MERARVTKKARSGPETHPAKGSGAQAVSRRRISRRELLVDGGKGAVGLAALAAAGAGGFEIAQGHVAPSAAAGAAGALDAPVRFVTAPGLDPPRLQMTDLGVEQDHGYLLLTPSLVPGARGVDEAKAIAEGKGQEGLLLLDARNEVVWFQPTRHFATNLEVQQYMGKPVLTYWVGEIRDGIGYGEGHVLDGTYAEIARLRAPRGLDVDLHELTLTSRGTALVTSYRLRDADLRPVGGPKRGAAWDGMVLEIDVATGRTVFEWSSLDHVPVEDSYARPTGGPFDYFHINSIAPWDDTSLLVSGRNTWALYRVDRRSGEVIWRMHGKRTDFAMGPGTQYYWQHHARHLASGPLTVFDDGATPPEQEQSRALFLSVDEARRKVSLVKAYTHPVPLLASYEGSVQELPDGHVFVGWGTEPYASEFDQAGDLLLDARLPTNVQSYRALRSPWTGRPRTRPALVVVRDDVGGHAAHVSWNGATEVREWEILTGPTSASLAAEARIPKAGFETAVTIRTSERFLAVAALDEDGNRIGISAAHAL